MSSCPHGGSTNCRQCNEYAYMAVLTHSVKATEWRIKRIAELEFDNEALRQHVAKLMEENAQLRMPKG